MRRTPLTAMLTPCRRAGEQHRAGGVRRQIELLLHEIERDADDEHDADEHDDDAQAQDQTRLLSRHPGLAEAPSVWAARRRSRSRATVAERAEHAAGRVERLHGHVGVLLRAASSSSRSRSAAIVALRLQRAGAARPRARARTATSVAPFQLACTIVSSPVSLRLASDRRRAQRAPAPGEAEGAVEGHVVWLVGVEQQRAVGANSLIAGTPP